MSSIMNMVGSFRTLVLLIITSPFEPYLVSQGNRSFRDKHLSKKGLNFWDVDLQTGIYFSKASKLFFYELRIDLKGLFFNKII